MMMITFTSLFIISTSVFICYASNCAKSPNMNPSIDYVQLAIQNANGFCTLKSCTTSVSGWTIHGLWPSQKGAMGPNGCNGTYFDTSEVKTILDQMDKEWPSLYGESGNAGFWSHEWCKHGTCAVAGQISSITSMLSYFQKTLSLFESIDVESALSRRGISHSSVKTYQLADFVNSFSSTAYFECQTSDEGQNVLFQARFCFTTDLEPVDCQRDWFASIDPCDNDAPIYYV